MALRSEGTNSQEGHPAMYDRTILTNNYRKRFSVQLSK
jgi:hypothetical protein